MFTSVTHRGKNIIANLQNTLVLPFNCILLPVAHLHPNQSQLGHALPCPEEDVGGCCWTANNQRNGVCEMSDEV